MSVTVAEWDGGTFMRATMAEGALGRGGRRHAPVGDQGDGAYSDPTNLPILFEDERTLKRAAARLTPNTDRPGEGSQAQILFNRRGGRLAFPTEIVVLVKLTPTYAVAYRALVTHHSGGVKDDGTPMVSPLVFLRQLRAMDDPDYRTAQWVFSRLGYDADAREALALPFRRDAPAGSMTTLRNESLRKLGQTADLRSILGPEAAREFQAEQSELDDLLGALDT